MRTLLIEAVPGTGGSTAELLAAAGHDVETCHPHDTPSFPCSGLDGAGCPLDGRTGIDVVVAVRDGAGPAPTVDESGVTCALRQGVPVVVVGEPEADPFHEWVEECAPGDDLVAACERAIVASHERRAEPLRDEVVRLLEAEGLDGSGAEVRITRHGDRAQITVVPATPVPVRLVGALATRVHAVDAKGTWPTSMLDVEVVTEKG